MATLSSLEQIVQMLEEDLFSEMEQIQKVEKKEGDLVIAQGQVINPNQGDDSFDRILKEEDAGPDPNAAGFGGGGAAPSDSHKAIQETLSKASSQLSASVQALATVKSQMTDFFSK